MIVKSGSSFSEKITLRQNVRTPSDPKDKCAENANRFNRQPSNIDLQAPQAARCWQAKTSPKPRHQSQDTQDNQKPGLRTRASPHHAMGLKNAN
jgi:hypothetical protein